MIPRLSILVFALGACALGGCSSSDNVSLVISSVAAPDQQCMVASDPDLFASSGVYDPQIVTAYTFAPILINQLTLSQTSVQTSFEDSVVFVDGNSINVTGFDVCYIRGDDDRVREFGTFADGIPVDCAADNLPGEFIPAALTLPPTTLGPSLADVLNSAALGDTFDDWDPMTRTFTGAAQRSAIIIMRAVGARTNGQSVTSDFFAYQVDVVPGLAAAVCGSVDAIDEICDISLLSVDCINAG